jgi:uncharacterized DUF497 family protein
VAFEWDDARKAGLNFRKHGVRLPEAIPIFEDPHAITVTDSESDSNERRFVTLGMGCCGPFAGRRIHLAQRKHTNHFRAARRTA